ncbi:MAG: tRNA dihydrouridine synthase [Phycisphaerae bacterium]
MLKLGPIELDFPVVQAALSGYSDAAMRVIARRCGAPFAIHEVVLDKLLIQKSKLHKKIFHVPAEDHPVGGQIMGADPVEFGQAAAVMAEVFDLVDINFGCPVRKVLGRCRGGFLLSEPDTAIEIIRRVRDAVPKEKPVTVKMRRGLDDTPESEANFWRILDAAFEYGAAAVTVHGRTVEQRYIGPSRWEFLTRVKKHVGDRTILGSGDLFTPEDIKRMLDETGIDGVTVARGCIGNPWIFRETRALLEGRELPPPPSVPEQGEIIREHYRLCAEIEGASQASRLMRKFGIKYSELHPNGLEVRDAFVRAKNAGEWTAVLDEWYSPDRDWPEVQRKTGAGDLVAAGACG